MTPDEFKAARERAGLTQRKCAALFGVNIRTVARWEEGKSRIPHIAAFLFHAYQQIRGLP